MKADVQKIEELLTRGVEQVYPSVEYLRSRLVSGDKLTIYLGIDPTGPTLHVGHLIPLLKLRALQMLGHRVILLVGDFTAMIGDPTDKSATRTALSREQVLENARMYKEQASRLIDFDGPNPASLKYNSEWLDKLSFADALTLASKMTFAQTIKREMFKKRIAEGRDLYIHEFMYPLMQGYDSVAMDVDGEVGGNDQTFNMLVGRDLMKKIKGKEKFVIAMKILAGSDGVKMGKTAGNVVSFSDRPEVVFGAVMSWTDSLIIPGMELCTNIEMEAVYGWRDKIAAGTNPRDAKMELARGVVEVYYGKDAALRAESEFINVFQKKDLPDQIKSVEVSREQTVVSVLLQNKLVKSMSEFRRLVKEGAVAMDETELTDPLSVVGAGGIVRIGKRRFIKLLTTY